MRREAEETLNEQVTGFYSLETEGGKRAGMGCENPIRIEVDKYTSGIGVTLLPKF